MPSDHIADTKSQDQFKVITAVPGRMRSYPMDSGVVHYWRGSGPLKHIAKTQRAALAASMIEPGSRVLDLGCGAQALKSLLPQGSVYVPADIQARTPDTIVVDLNRGEFPSGAFDATVMLGVIEYLNDPVGVLAKVREHAPVLVCSYTSKLWVSRRSLKAGAELDRANYFSYRQFRKVLASAGWKVIERKIVSWRPLRRQDIFKVGT